MKKIVSLLLMLTVLFSAVAVTGGIVNAATTIAQDQQTLNSLENKKAANNAKRAELNNQIAQLKGQYENNYQRKLILEESIQLADEEIQTIESLISGYEDRLKELTEERFRQQEKLDEYYEIYSQILTYYYKYGEASSLELLLSAEDISDFLTRLDYLKYIMEYNNTITDSIRLEKENVEKTGALYEESQSKLAAERDALITAKDEYEKQTAELDQLNNEINTNLVLTEKQQKELLSVQQQIEQDIKTVSQQIKDKLVYTETDYAWPIDSAYWSSPSVVITCKFGNRINPITGKQELHNGLDIAAPRGTPIQAAKSGVVIRSEFSGGWGNVIVILHSDGTSTLYAHCDKLLVSKGATVMQGQVIARVGTTGQSTGNHLHFTIYNGSNVAVNPVDYLDEVFIKTLNKRGLSLK